MKILHCLSQRPEATGSGITINAILKEAANKGHDNYLIAGIPLGPEPQLDFINADRISFITFEGGDLPHPVAGMSDVMPYKSKRFSDLDESEIAFYEKCFYEKIKSVIDRFQPDIIHSHHLWLMSSMIKNKFPHIPLAISCHGSDLRQFQKLEHLQTKVKEACQKAQVVFALSQQQKNEIASLYGIDDNKVSVVGAGYDHELFCSPTIKKTTTLNIVYAGKLSRAKGLIFLLRALKKLDNDNWHCHLLGDGSGEEKEEVLESVKSFDTQVTAHGLVAHKEMAGHLQSADIFVLPSLFEGLPLVLLEALACDCRLITCALPGATELLDGIASDDIDIVSLPRLKNFDEVIEEDEEAFVEQIKQSLERQIKRCAESPFDKEAFTKRLSSYTWPGIFSKIEKGYLNI